MNDAITYIIPLLLGWLLDLAFGDPAWLPHPIVGFGRLISFGEHKLNKGHHRQLKGGLMAMADIAIIFVITWIIHSQLMACDLRLSMLFDTIIIFYCLAGTTLIREVREVFHAMDHSIDEGRRQVARIVGRDTSQLSAQEIRTAALETLAENLSDGVIAPLFWLAIGGVPAMMAYKMVNTLDSMIGYRTARYREFGCVAAHIDDMANYVPARLTALLMIVAARLTSSAHLCKLISFVRRNGHKHASPNSGFPEAALAGILQCRFGGPHLYFGEMVDKPYIGDNERPLTTADMQTAVRINKISEMLAILMVLIIYCL